jgi:hypothetical protein
MKKFEIGYLYQRYRYEILISGIMAILTIVVTIIATILLADQNPRIIVDISIGFLLFLMLLSILFDHKKHLEDLFLKVISTMSEGEHFFRKDMYVERLKHFTKEKGILADALVNKELPKIVNRIIRENPSLTTLNIILDSGTTINPIFPELVCLG